MEMEVDARHVSRLVPAARSGQQESNIGVTWNSTSGTTWKLDGRESSSDPQVSSNVRLSYLSHDRSELAYATKEIARSMETPDDTSWIALMRAVPFCVERLVWSGSVRNNHFCLSWTVAARYATRRDGRRATAPLSISCGSRR